ncbi:MAG: histidine kinase [Nitrospirota bacterium]
MKTLIYNIRKHEEMDPYVSQSPQDWEGIFNTISDMITIHDKDFNIIHANNAARKILSLPDLETTKAVKCFKYYHGTGCPPEGCPSSQCIKTGIPAVFELVEPHLNMFVEIKSIPRFDSKNRVTGIIHIASDITKRKQSERELRDSRKKLRNLTSYLLSVREEERAEIAREIHDELAQSLTSLKMDLFLLEKKLRGDQKSAHELRKSMSKTVDMTVDTVKRISSDLRPGLLDDLGLLAAVKWQAARFQDRTGIACKITRNSEISSLDQKRSITIFRIFQEALTNVFRHAKAKEVKVNFKINAGKLLMEIRDNGRGITEEQISDPESLGLIGIQERVNLLRGKVEIIGIKNKGTTVTTEIPLVRSRRKKQTKRKSL